MYLTGSFIIALAMLGTTALTNLKGIPNDHGQKSAPYYQEENKILKVLSLFLLLFALIVLLANFSKSK